MKRLIFTKLIIGLGILFASFTYSGCANSEDVKSPSRKTGLNVEQVTITVELKKDARIKVSVRQKPDLDYSTELDGESQLPEFYARFKAALTESPDSMITIDSDAPVTINEATNLKAQAR